MLRAGRKAALPAVDERPILKELPMATQDKVTGPASYFPSIEKTYGQPIAHWMAVLDQAGPLKHMELVTLLKTGHQIGHGHANALVAWHRAKSGA
jgi:Domain of unknown function (DUF4287)